MRSPFLRGALSGVAAGLLAASVGYFLLEPSLRAAIALEGGTDDGLVSRGVQERLGAPIGFVLTGLALGLVLAGVDRGARSGGSPWQRSWWIALGLFTALVAVPQLRYPPSPPGVGDPETIGDRTGAYVLAIALGLVVVALVAVVLRQLHDADRLGPAQQVLVAAVAVALVAICWAVLPDNADPVDVPATLLWDFRIRSLAVTTLLWAVLGATYGALALRQQTRDLRPVAA